jgi:SAM-dependent methyltransferase
VDFVVKNYFIGNYQGKRFLDYCCGNGALAIFWAKKGIESVGIDISDVSIKNAKKLAEKERIINKTSFLIMDAENLKFPDNYFDLITCNGVLHHLDIKKAFPELNRVLKPGGKVICWEPLIYNPIFQIYRKMTPNLRTKWETEHILTKKDLNLASSYFGKIGLNFFHLTTLLDVPFRNIPVIFNPLLTLLEHIDSFLLKLPLIKWLAWQVVFILREPKK